MMRIKVLSLFAAVAMLGACTSDQSGTASSGGSGSGGTVQSTNSPSAAPTTPVGPAAGSQAELQEKVGDRVFFDFDSSELSADARNTLERQAFWMRNNPSVTVVIEGHCDERGTREYNLALGERRAAAAKDYLTALGVDGNRVRTISYGKERPAVPASNEEAWSKNRRSVTVVQ